MLTKMYFLHLNDKSHIILIPTHINIMCKQRYTKTQTYKSEEILTGISEAKFMLDEHLSQF